MKDSRFRAMNRFLVDIDWFQQFLVKLITVHPKCQVRFEACNKKTTFTVKKNLGVCQSGQLRQAPKQEFKRLALVDATLTAGCDTTI